MVNDTGKSAESKSERIREIAEFLITRFKTGDNAVGWILGKEDYDEVIQMGKRFCDDYGVANTSNAISCVMEANADAFAIFGLSAGSFNWIRYNGFNVYVK